MAKWTFEDPGTLDTYTFDINPNDDSMPPFKKTFTIASTSAPGGKTLVMEGRDEVRRGSFSGVMLSESQHTAFQTWYNKRNQIVVTDDMGQTYTIIIESYEPKRRRTISHPWIFDYTVNYIIVDWP